MVMAKKVVFEIRADSDCRMFSMANDNCRKFKPVSYTHLFVFKIKSTSCSVPNSEERSYLRAVKLAEIDIYQRHYAVNSAIREPL